MILLRFVRGSGWDSKVIEWDTRAWCSHVEAMLHPGATVGAMLSGGVEMRSTNDPRFYSRRDRAETWAIPATDEQRERFWEFIQRQIGRPYDWRAILSFGLGSRDWRSPDSWFCSELQSAALEAAGLIRLPQNLPACRITPRDVYMLVSQLPGAAREAAA